MQVLPVELQNPVHIRKFLELPFSIYQNVPQWVPPLLLEERRRLNVRRYPFYRNGAAAYFLAVDRQGIPLGRIVVLEDNKYNHHNHEEAAFFYLFESLDDIKVAAALFETAEQWARERGLNVLIGPKGFTIFDGLGMLVRGFEHRPAFGLPYNPPYYANLLEKLGFVCHDEMVSGYLNREIKFPTKFFELAERLRERRGLHVARFNSRRELRAFLPQLKDLYNAALAENDGNSPITNEEAKLLADQMLWFADPRLIKIVFKGEDPVGFLFAYPDISAAVQLTRGRVFPFGWIRLLIELRRTAWININGAGMAEGYRGLGGTALLFSEMYKSVMEGNYQHADIVQIGTANARMLREMNSFGINFYKMHRIYRKGL